MYKAAKMANAHDFIMNLPDVRKILRKFIEIINL
jgi:ABC-type multidrug transport system fused ATPase/permease subunit